MSLYQKIMFVNARRRGLTPFLFRGAVVGRDTFGRFVSLTK